MESNFDATAVQETHCGLNLLEVHVPFKFAVWSTVHSHVFSTVSGNQTVTPNFKRVKGMNLIAVQLLYCIAVAEDSNLCSNFALDFAGKISFM